VRSSRTPKKFEPYETTSQCLAPVDFVFSIAKSMLGGADVDIAATIPIE
jgi:hypothetical protein